MSENKSTNPQKAATEKVNPVDKIMGGLSNWLSALTGKPRVDLKKMESVVKKAPPEKAAIGDTLGEEEDSVKEDIIKAEHLLAKLVKATSKKVAPISEKGASMAASTLSQVGEATERKPVKKILVLVPLLIVVIGIVLVVVFTLGKSGGNGGGGGGNGGQVVGQTPTVIPVIPFKPSIYADDADILKLQEDIKVYQSEVLSTDLKLQELSIPKISFPVLFQN